MKFSFKTELLEVNYGVPQVLILDLPPFLIYINDLFKFYHLLDAITSVSDTKFSS